MNEVYVPHVGWLDYPIDDDVARFLREGWFEYDIQAFLFLYLRNGNIFVDGGAHAGLYSVLAGRLVGAAGRLVSVEPNPDNYVILERNLQRNRVSWATAIQAALYSRTEQMPFYPETPGRSAYGSLIPPDVPTNAVSVKALTLEGIRQELGIDQIAAVKIDTEGSEVEVLKGITQSACPAAFPLLIIEFTEMNLKRAGTNTENLYHSLEAAGYQVCRFDPDQRRLVRVEFNSPVWHANYFAAIAPEVVNDTIQNAPEKCRRIAGEIIERGHTCERLHRLMSGRAATVRARCWRRPSIS
jgi:FkbM family methyltransferase